MPVEINFTKANLDLITTPPKGKRVYYTDTNKKSVTLKGFGLVVSDSGSKHFVLTQYFKRDRKTVRLRCGEYPATTIERGRANALKLQDQLLAGIHPTEKRREEIAEQGADQLESELKSITLKEVLNNYVELRELKQSTATDYQSQMLQTWGAYMDKPMLGITEVMVKDTHRERSKASKAASNYSMRVLRALFNFARSEYKLSDGELIFKENPVSILSESRSWNKIKRRKTYISPDELPDWFDAVEGLTNTTARDYFKFLMLTGARRTEAARLLVDDVDFRSHTFQLRDTKNHEDVILPMSSYVEKMLRTRISKGQTWVFESSINNGHIVDMRKQLNAVKQASSIEFSLHDLRRSFITYGESLDISTYAVKRLVNHLTGEQSDVTMGYVGIDIDRLSKATQRITDFVLRNGIRKQAKVISMRA
jgi:integrase